MGFLGWIFCVEMKISLPSYKHSGSALSSGILFGDIYFISHISIRGFFSSLEGDLLDGVIEFRPSTMTPKVLCGNNLLHMRGCERTSSHLC